MSTDPDDAPVDATSAAGPAAVVAAFIAAVERRDVDAACDLIADECVYDNVPVGRVIGPEAVRRVLAPIVETSDEIAWPVVRSAVAGRVVFNERTDRFRTGDRWVELPVTGVWEVRDGRITLWRDYFDLETYRRQTSPRPG
jgi:limonene-1,2-epoxide hydrolase